MGKSIEERLMSYVALIPEHPCWEWIGSTNGYGYGHIHFNKKPAKAHRVSYELFVGPIPKGMDLDHLCRNRACVNPKHLEPVTRKENLNRSPLTFYRGGITTAKLIKARTHCPQGHEYNEQNTKLVNNGKWRACKECNKIGARKRYFNKKNEIF